MDEPIERSVVFTQFCFISHILKFYVSDENHLMNAMYISRNWADYVLSEYSQDFEKEVTLPDDTKSFTKIKSTKALFRAFNYRSFYFVDRCLSNYPEMILKRSKKSHSLLFLSIDDTEMFRFLFEKGMAMDEKDRGKTVTIPIPIPLHWNRVGLNMTHEVPKKLEFNELVKKEHIFHHAVKHGRTEIVRLLTEKGMEQHGDFQNNSPLHIAARYNQLEIALLLLNAKTSLNVHGESPLSIAIDKGNYDIAKVLLDDGANPSNKDNKGESLLHKVIDKRDDRMAHLLLDYRADVTCKNNFGLTPFYKLIHSNNPDPNLAKKFLMRGIREQHLWGLFCHSVRMKYYEIVEMMLEFVGADLIRLSQNDILQIPLRSATTDKDDKMIFLFRKHHLYARQKMVQYFF